MEPQEAEIECLFGHGEVESGEQKRTKENTFCVFTCYYRKIRLAGS